MSDRASTGRSGWLPFQVAITGAVVGPARRHVCVSARGIDTGPAIIGNMGSVRRIKYGVVGRVVNSAFRIETLTVGGQVLVSDAARRALGQDEVTATAGGGPRARRRG